MMSASAAISRAPISCPAISWGRVFRPNSPHVWLWDRDAALPRPPAGVRSVLPFGNGRSYGDSCLNPDGLLLMTRKLDRFVSFDAESGVLICEAGVLLADILDRVVPQGWFLPVTPGTKFVTVGGAIANDVHGKNHHKVGSFGHFVRRFELLRSSGERLECTPEGQPELFQATVGGLGLTGLITWAELQLRPVSGPWMDVESIRYDHVDQFFELSAESEAEWEYTVSWLDCSARGRSLGRGVFIRANHVSDASITGDPPRSSLSFPITPPVSLINRASLRLLNSLIYRKEPRGRRRFIQHYEPYFYPLDRIHNWNRIYGPRGFYQYQCVLPQAESPRALRGLLQAIARSGTGSCLTVLKMFGNVVSRGMLSFPREGVTLALDFPNDGDRVHRLFEALDAVVLEAGGRLYPAKDGRMPASMFAAGYPSWRRFVKYVDPQFSSGFWRRTAEQL
jgi:FAD/FMN-containing dehydrogenase